MCKLSKTTNWSKKKLQVKLENTKIKTEYTKPYGIQQKPWGKFITVCTDIKKEDPNQ